MSCTVSPIIWSLSLNANASISAMTKKYTLEQHPPWCTPLIHWEGYRKIAVVLNFNHKVPVQYLGPFSNYGSKSKKI